MLTLHAFVIEGISDQAKKLGSIILPLRREVSVKLISLWKNGRKSGMNVWAKVFLAEGKIE